MILKAFLPADRRMTGTILLQGASGHVLWGPVPCLGKADNAGAARARNPKRSPLFPYGDHPMGTYKITGWSPTLPEETDRFGPYGKLVLDPVAGQALEAKRNGRYGLLIHGGALGGPYRLRPTYGCLRLANHDAKALTGLWRSFYGSDTPMEYYQAMEAR